MADKMRKLVKQQIERLQQMLEKAHSAKKIFEGRLQKSKPGSTDAEDAKTKLGIIEHGMERIQALLERVKREASTITERRALPRAKKMPRKAKAQKLPKAREKKKPKEKPRAKKAAQKKQKRRGGK